MSEVRKSLLSKLVIRGVITFTALRETAAMYVSLAALLRSLRADDPLGKGHPRSINQELDL